MNKMITARELRGAAWERPTTEPDNTLTNRTAADIDQWRDLTDRVIAAASANGWSKAEVARRINMADGTFNQWFSGKYAGRLDGHNRQVMHWLDAVDESAELVASIPQSPGFIKTIASSEIMDTLSWAQTMGDFVIVTYSAGLGKTTTCRQYQSTRPYVHMITMSPHTRTVHGMLIDLAAELDVMQHNPAKLARAIGNKLARKGGGTLLIVDEAQNLIDEAINQLRHFVDVYKCGLALVGNDEVYRRFTRETVKGEPINGPSYAQLKRRIGRRLKRDRAETADLLDFIAAWGVTDPDCVKLLTAYGRKGGALGQIDQTLKQASTYAMGDGKPINVGHIQAAWRVRDVEDVA